MFCHLVPRRKLPPPSITVHSLKTTYLYSSMKRFALTLLAFVYITISCGATVHLHYCMNKLIGWGLTNKSPDKCGKCGMEKSSHKGCCHDEHKIIKASHDNKLTETPYPISPITAFQPAQPNLISNTFTFPVGAALHSNSHGPPRSLLIPTYILICVFRI